MEHRYIRILWQHDSHIDPVEIWSEIGSDGRERRNIEFFRDGRIGCASLEKMCDPRTGTILAEGTIPDMDEIPSDPGLEARMVSKEEFEERWRVLSQSNDSGAV